MATIKLTTYDMLKNIINADKKEEVIDDTYRDDMMKKLDAFLLANRITSTQYTELVEFLN